MYLIFNGIDYEVSIIFLVIFAIHLVVFYLRKYSFPRILFFIIFYIYLVALISKTLFPIRVSSEYLDSTGIKSGYFSPINLKPFYFGASTRLRLIIYGIVANIFLTIPFGFGINFVARVKAKAFYWIPFAVGLGIEVTQLIISLIIKHYYRVIDINDVIMNAIGVLIGYAFFRIFSIIILNTMKRAKAKNTEFVNYFAEVVKRSMK